MTKIVARRDSATTILRKLGVNQRDYNLFIAAVPQPNGMADQYDVNVDLAKAHVAKIAVQTGQEDAPPKTNAVEAMVAAVTKTPKSKKEAAPKTPKVKQVKAPKSSNDLGKPGTVSFVARQLIVDGKTNAEVWAIIQPQFNLSDKKRLYPAWFRRELKLKGVIKG